MRCTKGGDSGWPTRKEKGKKESNRVKTKTHDSSAASSGVSFEPFPPAVTPSLAANLAALFPPFLPLYLTLASSATEGFARMFDRILPDLNSRNSFPVRLEDGAEVRTEEERERPGSENATTCATVENVNLV